MGLVSMNKSLDREADPSTVIGITKVCIRRTGAND
jgi:hypothetical protein